MTKAAVDLLKTLDEEREGIFGTQSAASGP